MGAVELRSKTTLKILEHPQHFGTTHTMLVIVTQKNYIRVSKTLWFSQIFILFSLPLLALEVLDKNYLYLLNIKNDALLNQLDIAIQHIHISQEIETFIYSISLHLFSQSTKSNPSQRWFLVPIDLMKKKLSLPELDTRIKKFNL